MSDYKEYKLRDLVTFSQGIQVPVEEQSNIRHSNMERFVRIVDFTNPNEEPRFIKVKDSKYWVNKKDVVMIRYGSATAGKVVRGLEGYIANNMFKVIPNESILNEEFLYYFLSQSSIYSYLMNSQSSSTMPAIKFSDFDNIKIKLPSLDIQKHIVLKLNRLNNKIELNTQINQTLEQIAQALFKSWFVDFDPVRAKVQALSDGLSLEQAELAAMQAISGKTPEELTALSQTQPDRYAELAETAKAFPCEMVEVDGVEVPKGWELSTIGEEVETVGGATPSTKEESFWNNGKIAWTTPKDLSFATNPVLINTERKITELGLKKISSGLLPIGTVLLSSRAPVGYLALTKIPVAINQGYIAIKCNKTLSNFYMLQWCKENLEEIKSRASGTTFLEISKTTFRGISVIVPEKNILIMFNKQCESIYEMVTNHTKENQKLEKVRDLLLPRLLNGEI